MPVILMRESGLSAGAVGSGLGGAITLGSVLGLTAAAVAARYLKPKWGALTPVRVSQIGYLIYGLLSPLYFLARTPGETFMIATVQMAMGIGGNSLMPTVVQDLAPRELRARVFAISYVMVTLFTVMSPIAVGLLSDHVYAQHGGLLKASITLAFPALIAAAMILRLAERHIMTTTDKVRASADVDHTLPTDPVAALP
jgi:MFS family permease